MHSKVHCDSPTSVSSTSAILGIPLFFTTAHLHDNLIARLNVTPVILVYIYSRLLSLTNSTSTLLLLNFSGFRSKPLRWKCQVNNSTSQWLFVKSSSVWLSLLLIESICYWIEHKSTNFDLMLTVIDKHTACCFQCPLDKHLAKEMTVSYIKDFSLQAHCAWLLRASLREIFVEMLRKTKSISYCVGFQMLEFIYW